MELPAVPLFHTRINTLVSGVFEDVRKKDARTPEKVCRGRLRLPPLSLTFEHSAHQRSFSTVLKLGAPSFFHVGKEQFLVVKNA